MVIPCSIDIVILFMVEMWSIFVVDVIHNRCHPIIFVGIIGFVVETIFNIAQGVIHPIPVKFVCLFFKQLFFKGCNASCKSAV